MSFVYVTKNDVTRATTSLKSAKAFKGLTTTHALRPYNNHIWQHETSCFDVCCTEQPNCEGWKETGIYQDLEPQRKQHKRTPDKILKHGPEKAPQNVPDNSSEGLRDQEPNKRMSE